MTDSDLLSAANWSYGIALAGFLAFALRVALGWRGGLRATLLLLATLASALWAASVLALGVWQSSAAWVISSVLDTLRYALWFAFLDCLVHTRSTSAGRPHARFAAIPWWIVAVVGVGLCASIVLPNGDPLRAVFGERAVTFVYTVRVALSVVGLVLVERLLRSAAPHAR